MACISLFLEFGINVFQMRKLFQNIIQNVFTQDHKTRFGHEKTWPSYRFLMTQQYLTAVNLGCALGSKNP